MHLAFFLCLGDSEWQITVKRRGGIRSWRNRIWELKTPPSRCSFVYKSLLQILEAKIEKRELSFLLMQVHYSIYYESS